jgi:hypothetical protein
MIKTALKSIGESISFVVCLILGILLAAGTFVWYFIPKWKKEEEADTARRFEKIRATVKEAHELRATETAQKVSEVEKKASEQKMQDAVELANQFILDELKK